MGVSGNDATQNIATGPHNHTLAHIYGYNIHIPVSYFLLLLILILFTSCSYWFSFTACLHCLHCLQPGTKAQLPMDPWYFRIIPWEEPLHPQRNLEWIGIHGHPTIFQHGPISQEKIGVFPGLSRTKAGFRSWRCSFKEQPGGPENLTFRTLGPCQRWQHPPKMEGSTNNYGDHSHPQSWCFLRK